MYRQLLKKSQPYLDYILTQSMREHDTTRPAGKVETLNAILPFLVKVRDRIERAEYAEHIADRLKLEGRVVREELKRAAVGKQRQLDPAKVALSTRVLPAERRLLEMLLSSPQLRRALSRELTLELVCGLATTPIFTALLNLMKNGDEVDFASLQAAIVQAGSADIDRCKSILTGLMVSGAELDALEEAELLAEARRALAALKRTRTEHEMAAVQHEINQAQREGNHSRATELSLRKFELARRLKEHFD